MNKYLPSNGTEGMAFTDAYCMQCINCNPNPEGKKQCDILCRSMAYDVNEDEYPKEWTYDKEGRPICTSWNKWDWDTQGDPDDPENPKAPVPFNPNQLLLF